jgi:hypothetical protein
MAINFICHQAPKPFQTGQLLGDHAFEKTFVIGTSLGLGSRHFFVDYVNGLRHLIGDGRTTFIDRECSSPRKVSPSLDGFARTDQARLIRLHQHKCPAWSALIARPGRAFAIRDPIKRVNPNLVDHVDGFLSHCIECCNCFGVGLKGALCNDQVRKLR